MINDELMEDYLNRSMKVRGVIIGHCCQLERKIDTILTKYFAKDDTHQRQLMELLFCTEKLSLRSKIDLLAQVCQLKLPNKKSFNVVFKGYFKKFSHFSSQRNLFAHDMDVLLTDKFIPTQDLTKYDIVLMPFKDGVDLKYYTTKDINDFVDFTEDLYEMVEKIGRIILGR
jgi:hypothetical protein